MFTICKTWQSDLRNINIKAGHITKDKALYMDISINVNTLTEDLNLDSVNCYTLTTYDAYNEQESEAGALSAI